MSELIVSSLRSDRFDTHAANASKQVAQGAAKALGAKLHPSSSGRVTFRMQSKDLDRLSSHVGPEINQSIVVEPVIYHLLEPEGLINYPTLELGFPRFSFAGKSGVYAPLSGCGRNGLSSGGGTIGLSQSSGNIGLSNSGSGILGLNNGGGTIGLSNGGGTIGLSNGGGTIGLSNGGGTIGLSGWAGGVSQVGLGNLPPWGAQTNDGWLSKQGILHKNQSKRIGNGRSFTVQVSGRRGRTLNSLVGAKVTLLLAGQEQFESVDFNTDKNGQAVFNLGDYWHILSVGVFPSSGFCPSVAFSPNGNSLDICCEAIPRAKNGGGWWHEMHGVPSASAARGKGVRIGIIDSGIGAKIPINVTSKSSFSNGKKIRSFPDGIGHGTHVAGIIGAPPNVAGFCSGIAPGAELHIAKVFHGSQSYGCDQVDVANAIDFLSKEKKVDVINMSLGAQLPSAIIHDAIIDAFQRGTAFVCATGNSGGLVNFPAAFPECIGVSALGRTGWSSESIEGSGPSNSLANCRRPVSSFDFGNNGTFLANDSCRGAGVDFGAAGVGVMSLALEGHSTNSPAYVSKSGTSMAAPIVTGVMAALASCDATYKNLPRDNRRCFRAYQLLRESAADVGLGIEQVGFGVPQVM